MHLLLDLERPLELLLSPFVLLGELVVDLVDCLLDPQPQLLDLAPLTP